MTDEEMKRLEEFAEDAETGPQEYRQWLLGHFHNLATPSAVLALIERVRKAERKGAEEMRAAAVDGCREWSIPMPIDVWQGTKKELSAATARALADRIQLLPLPGDAP